MVGLGQEKPRDYSAGFAVCSAPPNELDTKLKYRMMSVGVVKMAFSRHQNEEARNARSWVGGGCEGDSGVRRRWVPRIGSRVKRAAEVWWQRSGAEDQSAVNRQTAGDEARGQQSKWKEVEMGQGT